MLYEGEINGKDWFLGFAPRSLADAFDDRFPNRDTASDGSIGDPAHMATVSDHNPDWQVRGGSDSDRYGVVRAVDIDAGLDRKDPTAMHRASRQLARYAKAGKDKDTIAYLIFNQEICSPVDNWEWRPYDGSNPHITHLHASFTRRGDLRVDNWDIRIFNAPDRWATQLRHVRHDIEFKLKPEYREAMRNLEQARREARKLQNVLADHR